MTDDDLARFREAFTSSNCLVASNFSISAVLMIAPSARHRARFRDRDKEAIVVSSNQLTLASTGFLATAMIAVVVLLGEYLYNWVLGIVGGVVTFALVGWFWYGWSITRNIRRGD